MAWAVIGAGVVALLYLAFAYNGLVALRARADQAFSDIDAQLRQRHDLIPNLVETVKGYATHERETLDAVVRARNGAVGAQGPQAQAAAEGALSGAVGRLLALGEAYPDLKASASFQALQGELAESENKLAAARRFFNNAVAEYNAAIAAIPAVAFAGPLGFRPRSGFDLGEAQRQSLEAPPRVRF